MENHYNIIKIQQYLAGQLSRKEMYELEREALEDPFLGDAIEGYRLQKEVNHGQLSLLQQRLAQRVAGKQEEKNRFFFTSQRLGVAATAAVLFLLVVVLYLMRSNLFSDQDQLASETGTEVQKELNIIGELPQKIAVIAPLNTDLEFAEPENGWVNLNAYIQDNFSWGEVFQTTRDGDRYLIVFEITENTPTNLQITKLNEPDTQVDNLLFQEIESILINGPNWRGQKGQFELSFTK